MALRKTALWLLSLFAFAGTAHAQDQQWTASSILDVPYGPKQALRSAGIDLGMNYTGFYQGLVGGEGDQDWAYGGKLDAIANFDDGKIGLWQGLYINAHFEAVHGDDVLNQGDGSILPVNTALAFPTLGGHDMDLSIIVTQVFDKKTSLSIGKFNMLDAAAKTPLIKGGGIVSFWNTGLAAPISGVTPPYILAGILTHKVDPLTFTLMVYDPRNAQDFDVIKHPFADGITTSLSATYQTKLGGLPGFYGVRGVYSTKSGTDFGDIAEIILPPEARNIGTKDGYWFLSASFQQYLQTVGADPSKGWGLFGQIAVSDGNPNPVGWSGFAGIGGNSFIAGRPDDLWGLSYFYYGFSDELRDGLGQLGVRLEDEHGFEAYYSLAVTRWLNLAADAQIISPGTGQDTAYFLGLRAHLKVF